MPTPRTPKKERERLDVLLVKRGHFETRERAQAAILAGEVFVAGQRADKPGTRFPADAAIEVRGQGIPYVGRGGLKLARALDTFHVDPAGRTAIDVGASTGGFTDVLLQRGAAHVFAVDVGYGQIAWKLRSDPRVTVLDRTNIRHLRREDLLATPGLAPGEELGPVSRPSPPPARLPDLAVVDVSFISLEKVLPAIRDLLAPPGEIVALVKPQFEAGPEKVGKGGIIRDPVVHREVLAHVAEEAGRLGYRVAGLTHSPIAGTEGNIEFLIHLLPGAGPTPAVEEVVDEAWRAVKG